MGATLFVQPLDLVKNRMQLSGMQGTREFTSSLHALRTIVAREGPLALYNDSKKAFFALPTGANDAQALLANFYACIRKNREERRNFLSSLLKLFSEEHKEKVARKEWVYIADNLAHFPYTVLDEPLYVIYQANAIISLSGQSIISQFRQLLLCHQTGPTAGGELEEFSVAYINDHLPSDRAPILELMQNSQACFLLLYLKLFLMELYELRNKIDEYSPSEAREVYEKPCSRRNIRCFAPDFAINESAVVAGGPSPPQRTVAEEIAERRRTAEHFHKFHEMLLLLDEQGEECVDVQQKAIAAATTAC